MNDLALDELHLSDITCTMRQIDFRSNDWDEQKKETRRERRIEISNEKKPKEWRKEERN